MYVVDVISENAIARDLLRDLMLALAEVDVPAAQVAGLLRRETHAAHLAALVAVAIQLGEHVPVQLDPRRRYVNFCEGKHEVPREIPCDRMFAENTKDVHFLAACF